MTSTPWVDRLRVIVVDDEPLAREGLEESIEHLVAAGQVPSMTVVASCESGPAALTAIRELSPDIALVDVQMPLVSGLEMLAQLEPEAMPPAVIMVTAHTQYALGAFGVRALDYLVKPVPRPVLGESLARAATRVAEVRALRAATEAPPPLPGATQTEPYLRRLVIPDRGQRLVVPVDDIVWIEGETYYVRVHTQRQSRLLRERLGALAEALDPAEFFRTHRSAIVRLAEVREVRTDGAYSASVVLASGVRVPLSRDRVRELEAILKARR
jgi:two-component system, LytTR family, response regulator